LYLDNSNEAVILKLNIMNALLNNWNKLSDLVISFNGDSIAECFKNKLVKKVSECNETTMFTTNDGKLFSIYSNLLKK